METLKKAASGMQCKARGAQRPRHINRIGDGVSTAQRRDAPAQPFFQRFPNDHGGCHHPWKMKIGTAVEVAPRIRVRGRLGRDFRARNRFDRRRARARPASLAAPGKNVRYRERAVAGKPAPTKKYAFRVIFTLNDAMTVPVASLLARLAGFFERRRSLLLPAMLTLLHT